MKAFFFRLAALSSLLLFVSQAGVAADAQGTRTYPPYPDVWDWVPGAKETTPFVLIFRKYDGDLLLDHLYGPSPKKGEQLISFFGRHRYGRSTLKDKTLKLSDYASRASLPNGRVIEMFGNKGGCGGDGTNLHLSALSATTNIKKVIAVVFDKPIHVPKIPCGDEDGEDEEGDYDTSVSIAFLSDITPLEDNTFLATIDNSEIGIVLRFDDQLNSRSALIGKKLFLIDKGQFDRFIADSNDKWKASGRRDEYDNRRSYHSALFKELHDWLLKPRPTTTQ